MSIPAWLHIAASITFMVALVPANLSPVVYHVKSHGDWQDTDTGRHVMAYMSVLAFVLDLTLVLAIWQPLWLLVLVPFAWLLLASVIIWRLALILDGWKPRPPGRRRACRRK